MSHDVFVSYPSVDKATADGVVAALESHGLRCWYAPRDVIAGADWAGSIVQAIGASQLVVLVFSEAANASDHILREVRQAADARIPILPFRISPEAPNSSLEYYIGGTHWLDALTRPLEDHLEQLVETARRILGEEPSSPVSTQRVPRDLPPVTTPSVPQGFTSIRSWLGGLPHLTLGVAIAVVVLAGAGVVAIISKGGETAAPVTAAPAGSQTTVSEDAAQPTLSATDPITSTATTTTTTTSIVVEVGQEDTHFEDQFDGRLDSRWNWASQDSSRWSLTDMPGTLWIIAAGSEPSQNVLLRPVPNGDFEITTLIRFRPTSNYQFAGLVVYGGPDDFLQVGRSYCDELWCVGDGIYFDSLQAGQLTGDNYARAVEALPDTYLRIRAKGDTYTGSYSSDGDTWVTLGSHEQVLTAPQVGLIAHQITVEAVAEFEYFTLSQGGLTWFHNPTTDHYYALTRSGLSPEQLNALAQEYGGHLVSIGDAAEEEWLYSYFGPTMFWIGLTDQAAEGEWRWTSGEPATYLPWCPGEPTDTAGGAGPEDAAHAIPILECWNDEPVWVTEFVDELGNLIPSYPGVIELDHDSN